MKTLLAAILALLGSVAVVQADQPSEVTACIRPEHQFRRVAPGSEPASPCNSKQTEVTMPTAGRLPANVKIEMLPTSQQDLLVAGNGSLIVRLHCTINTLNGDETNTQANVDVVTQSDDEWLLTREHRMRAEPLVSAPTLLGAGASRVTNYEFLSQYEAGWLDAHFARVGDGTYIQVQLFTTITNAPDRSCAFTGRIQMSEPG